ncbi:uncharacterized protein C19orf44 homolog [Protopterus annectens]|uniref:uncharacterized protein C19orf44 homolog n=1 Tax=Protopterus annectens TaxID=7888 RepID=UPI001CF9A826|nr:uncharacterized protein C19orf44 homolog [Protopterus annectens]
MCLKMWKDNSGRISALTRAQAQLSGQRVPTNSGRSSALSRAQAQLSGQRVPVRSTDKLQEYASILEKKTSSLKLRDVQSGEFSDLSDVSLDTNDSNETKENSFLKTVSNQGIVINENHSGSRFLKKKKNEEQKQTINLDKALVPIDTKKPRDNLTRFQSSSAALSRLVQIENKIANRKLKMSLPDTDSEIWTSDERPFSARSSSELSARGSRFLKRKSPASVSTDVASAIQTGQSPTNQSVRPTRESKSVVIDSDEEEMKMLIGSSLEYSEEDHVVGFRKPAFSKSFVHHKKLGTPSRTPSPPTRRPSLKNLSRTPSPPSKGSPRRTASRSHSPSPRIRRLSLKTLSRTPSPPSKRSPRQTPSRSHSPYRPPSTPTSPGSRGFLRWSQPTSYSAGKVVSRSPSSSRNSPGRTPSPRVRFMKQTLTSFNRSDIKSLDELFSDASIAEEVITENSIGSSDFRPNILSLDELVPDSRQPAERKSGRNLSQDMKKNRHTAEVPSNSKKSLFRGSSSHTMAGPHPPFDDIRKQSVPESDSETDISEHLSSSKATARESKLSATAQDHSEMDGSIDSYYSDDFETSAGRTSAEAVRTETTFQKSQRSKSAYSSDNSDGSESQSSTSFSTSSLQNCAASHITLQKEKIKQQTKTAVKEVAVQTQTPGFSYSWTFDSGSAVLGPPLGSAYVDPVPIASHVLSPDAVEALTAYNPSIFALNDMLKQQIALTQQFVQISRHLHSSLLESLEQENYHYITLKETKEFIASHKPAPLTFDQALKEVFQEMKEYHYIP